MAARLTAVRPEPAEAVQRHARRIIVETGIERRHAGDAEALLADLGAAAGDDIVDIRRVDAVPLHQGLQDMGEDALRMHFRQAALAQLADAARRAGCVDDPGFGHDRIPLPYAGGCPAI